jgi:hypothetical protein
LNGRRDWIRDAFVAFQRKFAGAKPSGPWAEQFSIIAWPITHAILPRDLQQQLARILYDLRHSFSAELFDEPQRLGDFIAARSWNTSARFQNLVQAPALVGQIAAALLLQGREGFKALLHPTTLKRIGDDVDRERRGRDWLLGARRAAEERAKIRGLTIGRSTNTTFQRREEARAEVVRLGIEPRLVLRPIEGARWEVSLEIPDLSHLLLRFPQVRDVLTESRCTVAGAAGRPLARGRCLHGPQRVPLGRWPRPDDVLLKFERTDAQLEYLLRAECMLRPGSSWLFKVASDGLAYESRGMRVRADSRYLLVSTEPLARSSVARPVELTCQGVHAVLLDVPAALSSEWEQALKQLQVTQAKSIEVWPAGLAAVAWDGEGHGEWLASETPTLAIRSDHAMDELTIAMGDGPSLSLSLTDTPPGEPIFVELPPLPVGLHKFSVAARSGKRRRLRGDRRSRRRHACPRSPPVVAGLDRARAARGGTGPRSAIARAALGGHRLRIRAWAHLDAKPSAGCRCSRARERRRSSSVNCRLSRCRSRARSGRGTSRRTSRRTRTRSTPTTTRTSARSSSPPTNSASSRSAASASSRRCGGLCGEPQTGFVARLHDDAGSGEAVIERFSFERPTVGERMTTSAEHKAPRAGGLYVATLGNFKAAIIVPPIVKGLVDLQCEPKIDTAQRTPETITKLMSFAQLWGKARLSGDLIAGARRGVVLRAFTAHIVALLGGRAWASAESKLKDERGLVDLKRSISDKGYELGLGSGLQLEYQALAAEPPTKRAARLASLAESFRLVQPSPNQREVVGRSSTPG